VVKQVNADVAMRVGLCPSQRAGGELEISTLLAAHAPLRPLWLALSSGQPSGNTVRILNARRVRRA
jgi:hypothetical protein